MISKNYEMRELIDLGRLIDTNLMFQNHHKITRVKDLNQLLSRIDYFAFFCSQWQIFL